MTKRRETWAATKPVFMLGEPKSRPPRSQSTHSSEEAGKPVWSEGVQEGGDAMTKPTEDQPEAVPERATRDGEILLRWSWVEPRVWTERMLTALEEGVKGGKWFSLIDKVHPVRTLRAAFSQVAANKGAAGVDHVTVEIFEHRLEENLKKLSEDLRSGNYQPQQIRRHYIPKPGSKEKRPLGIPTVRDRVVQTAVLMAWNPSSSATSRSTATAFAPDGDVKTHCVEWTSCSRRATRTSSMPI